MFSTITSGSSINTIENELTRRHAAKPTESTSEISIAVENLGTELQQDISTAQRTNSSIGKYVKKATPTLTLLCDAAASTLSYSAALFVNSSSPERAITSGVAWAAAGLFSGVEHTLLASKQMLTAVLADTTCFGAGVGSMASALLSKNGETQTLINSAAYISNSLWIASGTLSNIAVLRGEYNQAVQPSGVYLERTAKILLQLAGLADILAGLTGIISTAKTNGSSAPLNSLSSNFWMTSSLLNTFAAILQTHIKTLERNPKESVAPEIETQLQELKQQVEAHIAQISAQTVHIELQQTTMDQQRVELKTLHRVSDMQDATIAKLQEENGRKRAHLTKNSQDDSNASLTSTPKTFRHKRSFSETSPLLLESAEHN